jgi:hypothetical protein
MSKEILTHAKQSDIDKPFIDNPEQEFDASFKIRPSFLRSTVTHKEDIDPIYPLE